MSEDLNKRAQGKVAAAAGSGLAAVAVLALGPVGAAVLAVGTLAALEVAYQNDQRKRRTEE